MFVLHPYYMHIPCQNTARVPKNSKKNYGRAYLIDFQRVRDANLEKFYFGGRGAPLY